MCASRGASVHGEDRSKEIRTNRRNGLHGGAIRPARPDVVDDVPVPHHAELADDALVAGLAVEDAAVRGVEAVRSLLRTVELPATLRDFGLDPAELDIPTLVEDAMKSRNITNNPRPVTRDDLAELYRVVAG